MTNRQLFDLKRIFLLIRNYLLLNATMLLIVVGVVGTLVILISGLGASLRSGTNLHARLYLVVLYLSGFIITSRAFSELRDERSAAGWLTLPASTLDKFASRMIITSVGYTLGVMAVYLLIALLSEGINMWLFDYSHALFNPFSPMILKGSAVYLVLQSIFLVGAIYFRRFTLIKTILFLSVLSVVIILFVILASKLILGSQFSAMLRHESYFQWALMSKMCKEEIAGVLAIGFRVLFWFIIAPLCYVICYYRLKEFEA